MRAFTTIFQQRIKEKDASNFNGFPVEYTLDNKPPLFHRSELSLRPLAFQLLMVPRIHQAIHIGDNFTLETSTASRIERRASSLK